MLDMAPLARSAAEKALAINPANREARGIFGASSGNGRFRFGERPKRISARPWRVNSSLQWCEHAAPYGICCLWDESPKRTEQSPVALETDPLSMILHFSMAMCLYCAKQYRETIEYVRKSPGNRRETIGRSGEQLDGNSFTLLCAGSDYQLPKKCGTGSLVLRACVVARRVVTIRLAISSEARNGAEALRRAWSNLRGLSLLRSRRRGGCYVRCARRRVPGSANRRFSFYPTNRSFDPYRADRASKLCSSE